MAYIFGRPSQPDHHVSFPAAHSTDWLPLANSQQTPFLYSLLPLALRPPLPLPPQDFLNYPQFGGHFYTCQIKTWRTEASLFFVIMYSSPK